MVPPRAMKAIFVTSLASAMMSLMALAALSAVTVLPGSQAAAWHGVLMSVAGGCCIAWLGLAAWSRSQQKSHASPWFTRPVVGAGLVYDLAIVWLAIG